MQTLQWIELAFGQRMMHSILNLNNYSGCGCYGFYGTIEINLDMIKQKLMFNLTTTIMGICNFVWDQRRIRGTGMCFLSQMCLVVKIQPFHLVNAFNVMFLQMSMLANSKYDFSLATFHN